MSAIMAKVREQVITLTGKGISGDCMRLPFEIPRPIKLCLYALGLSTLPFLRK